MKNSPEPAEHGLQLGAALDAATRRRLTFARLLPFAPLPRGDGTAFRRGLHDGQVGDASWASSQTKQETFLMAGRARNTDGTHPRASSGARSVVSGPFSEACSWHSCSDFIACDKSSRLNCHVCDHQWRGAGPYASGVVACSPRRYRRIGRDSPAACLVARHPLNHKLRSSELLSRVVWAGSEPCSPPKNMCRGHALNHCQRPGVRGHLSHHLISGSS